MFLLKAIKETADSLLFQANDVWANVFLAIKEILYKTLFLYSLRSYTCKQSTAAQPSVSTLRDKFCIILKARYSW